MIVVITTLHKDKTTLIEERFDIKSIYTDSVGNLSMRQNNTVIPIIIKKEELIYFPEIVILIADKNNT